MSKSLELNCPTCQKKVTWNELSLFRPFCSERCQQIDLGAWADESYAIPAEPNEQWSGADTFELQSDAQDKHNIDNYKLQ